VRWLTGRVDGLPEVVDLEPEVPVLVDWLRSCPKTGECRISIDLLVTDNGSNDKDPNGTLVSWSAEARLEAFDGRPLADGAVELQHR
jgi:hypothetical protein